MFLENLYVGIPSNQTAKNAGTAGKIVRFSGQSGEKENILSYTAKGLDEKAIKLLADYLIKLKGQTIWVWVGEHADPIEGELVDIITNSDHSNGVIFDSIEVVFKTTF